MNPRAWIKKTAPTSESGMATTGTITERNDPRKSKMTTITIAMVSNSVSVTSRIALSMYFVESYAIVACIPLGRSFWIDCISLRTRAMTSSEFAFGRTQTPMNVAFLPENRTSES